MSENSVGTLFRDVSERKKTEEKLRVASLYSRSLLEASLDPLVTISSEGKITDVNRATESVTGFSEKTSSVVISQIILLNLKRQGKGIKKSSRMVL